MKYRIKQVGDWYYPQIKKFGFLWINMKDGACWDMQYRELEDADAAIRMAVLAAKKGKEVTIHQFKWDQNDYLD